ncbi:hypothetical protein JG687_00004675 [Phytophthora cactorum]|uniref:Uncharacterized protein n=1 Tax=Phytophthora cactorum TaxID=29920 RepID=A0A8T1UN10_9STRA|nr:hypothetical protein JG687_00004675 [Phytophthora cactorum]
MSVDELLNPPEENDLMEDSKVEDFYRVDTNSEYKAKGELSRVYATGEDEEDAADSTPENMFSEELKERLKWMAQLLELGRKQDRKQDRKQQKSMLNFMCRSTSFGSLP